MRKLVFLLLVISSCNLQIVAQRNYKFENFGNRSVLLNGNVTGSVDDLGATYYNPARLALVEEPVFLINAKMYQLTNIKLGNITLDGHDISSSNFNGIPSMVAGTFKIKKLEGHQFAYAVFSRNRSDLSVGYNSQIEQNDIFENTADIEKYVNATRIENKLRENWVGGSWAKTVAPNFSVGASLFFSTYTFENGYSESLNTISPIDEVISYSSNVHFEQKSYGLFAKIAVAWVLPKIELGLNIDLPYLEVLNKGKFKYKEYLSGLGSGEDIFTFNDFDDLNAKRKYPIGLSAGAGIPIKKHKLHVGLSYNAKINEYERIEIPELNSETEQDIPPIKFNEELKPVLNFGLGAEVYFSKAISGYGSFSSDYSPFVQNQSSEVSPAATSKDINFETDYLHVGFGVNVSHKWANFIGGAIYSRGSSKTNKPNSLPIDSTINQDAFSKIHISRWRFVIGIEVLFLDSSKLGKFGIDNRLF